jgi:hypothetical protein
MIAMIDNEVVAGWWGFPGYGLSRIDTTIRVVSRSERTKKGL